MEKKKKENENSGGSWVGFPQKQMLIQGFEFKWHIWGSGNTDGEEGKRDREGRRADSQCLLKIAIPWAGPAALFAGFSAT